VIIFVIQFFSAKVWLTKDGVPIILHGGDEGELNHHLPDTFKETMYIFDLTYEQILQYDMGEGERVPTLE
jgi:glycerophosphoryl diester phosphodiesterase